ncbi:hypothetical protein EVAR_78630_1 [Eumeta japonica]|uniref:Uncharacterized protein n=1 Tax=Eumeta variegata TaxID=151549 RepID=A0A4C1U947_EUMVA|nr:hypothetical protein EVAR_78630_1 [Eumeta japonica]
MRERGSRHVEKVPSNAAFAYGYTVTMQASTYACLRPWACPWKLARADRYRAHARRAANIARIDTALPQNNSCSTMAERQQQKSPVRHTDRKVNGSRSMLGRSHETGGGADDASSVPYIALEKWIFNGTNSASDGRIGFSSSMTSSLPGSKDGSREEEVMTFPGRSEPGLTEPRLRDSPRLEAWIRPC